MSDLLIKGMEMPKDCVVCPFGWNGCNKQHDFVYIGSRPDNCPLVPVPQHGRLIDADALPVSTAVPYDHASYEYVSLYNIRIAPAIIEADKADMDSFIRIFEEDDEEDGMDSFIQIPKD